jgi:hypothetical protein
MRAVMDLGLKMQLAVQRVSAARQICLKEMDV